MNIAERTQKIRERIQNACQSSQRDPKSITLMAVSKTYSSAHILDAAESGLRVIGENYVQEAVDKFDELKGNSLEWHFIGPLQSNKSRLIAERFDWLQSLDRIKIAKRLNEQRPEHMPALNVCIQVNISNDPAKSGLSVPEIPAFAEQLQSLERLNLRGIMAVPALDLEDSLLRHQFTELAQTLEQLKLSYPQVDTLSMGMTGDLETAIECGSTMIRVGSGIFGPRKKPA